MEAEIYDLLEWLVNTDTIVKYNKRIFVEDTGEMFLQVRMFSQGNAQDYIYIIVDKRGFIINGSTQHFKYAWKNILVIDFLLDTYNRLRKQPSVNS